MNKETIKRARSRDSFRYDPHLGYIGEAQVPVCNYLFSASGSKSGPAYRAHAHSKQLANKILDLGPKEHFKRSQKLTQFLRKRDLTFSKRDDFGNYQIFSVPVTTTLVPLPKSTFNQLEHAAQVLVVSLRKVLQSLYGSPSLAQSEFVKFLPESLRKVFIATIESSPQYLKALHHPVMKDYPFFDAVGLDLVLVDEYQKIASRLNSKSKGRELERLAQQLPDLPFKMLEINAGSPSGASNNSHILEGLSLVSPDLMKSLGAVMPNDHFKTLADTYLSLGEYWTGRKDGIAIVLPPGGANGAAPEIHQLAAMSGLLYVDPTQLYAGESEWVHLRTVTGNNPIVTSVYSRVNTDSALFSREKGILLRDQETGEPIYLEDAFVPPKNGKRAYILDTKGKKIPLESNYTIPNGLDAIHARKLYLGGLNRILDNKILLAILTRYATDFAKEELKKLGLKLELPRLAQPETLPSTLRSVQRIKEAPDDWVIKAPDLSGGNGVQILKTISNTARKKVLKMASLNPGEYAYQRLVRIARIPVSLSNGTKGYRFANLAADLRMWTFFGAGDRFPLPRLTHNALVRFASHEKGELSSIVNTSKGGGYAPFVVVDDTKSAQARSIKSHLNQKTPVPLAVDVPVFVAPQIIQILKMSRQIEEKLRDRGASPSYLHSLLLSIKIQVREVVSYLSPENMEPLNVMVEFLERYEDLPSYLSRQDLLQALRVELAEAVAVLEDRLSSEFFEMVEGLPGLREFHPDLSISDKQKKEKHKLYFKVRRLLKPYLKKGKKGRAHFERIDKVIQKISKIDLNQKKLNSNSRNYLSEQIRVFNRMIKDRFNHSLTSSYQDLLKGKEEINFGSSFLVPEVKQANEIRTASQWESFYGKPIWEETDFPGEVLQAKEEWKKIQIQARSYKEGLTRKRFLENSRIKHFEQFPMLKKAQAVINAPALAGQQAIEDLLPFLPYARFNLQKFLSETHQTLKTVFSKELEAGKIAIFSESQRKSKGLYSPYVVGECFLKRKFARSLLSESDVLLWISKEGSPFAVLNTIGHELVHYRQIQMIRQVEQESVAKGSLAFAQFLNFYGNFLEIATSTIESEKQLGMITRETFYGLSDLTRYYSRSKLVQQAFQEIRKGTHHFHKFLREYGSLLGWTVSASNPVRVKAIREVIPALENAKNIRFAKECGLQIPFDEYQSVLPIANKHQIQRCRESIEAAIYSPRPALESYRQIANHQLYGVFFDREQGFDPRHWFEPTLGPVFIQTNYNSVQQ